MSDNLPVDSLLAYVNAILSNLINLARVLKPLCIMILPVVKTLMPR
jgi:hypothetical protein